MKMRQKLKTSSALTLLTALPVSFAYAHPGHETADGLFHGLLHSEHLLLLLAIGAVAVIGKIIKDR